MMNIRLFSCVCFLVLFTQHLIAQCPASVPLAINSITTAESRCQSTGKATVSVTGGTSPYYYAITAGPVLASLQSSNVFESLPAGNYTVQVTDNCNTTATRTFVVAGSYAVAQINSTVQSPACYGASDGSLTISVNNGRAPFLYSLISPSPVTAGPQSNPYFNNLPAGAYTYRVTDSCGNYQTRTITISDGDDAPFYLNYGSLTYVDCDSFLLPYSISSSRLSPPYTVTLTLPDNSTQTHIFNINKTDTFRFRFHHITGDYNDLMINARNNCGTTRSIGFHLGMLDLRPGWSPIPGCSRQFQYFFDQGDNHYPGSSPQYNCPTVHYTLVSPSGVVLTTQTNNSSFAGYPPGDGYKVIREDCCKKDSLYFNWYEQGRMYISHYKFPLYVNKEGTTSLMVIAYNGSYGNIIVASGPSTVTFRDGTVHHYTYPDTLFNQKFNSPISINYFAEGTYKLIAVDTCGQKDSINVTIDAADVRHSTFSSTIKKGCLNDNKIIYNTTTNTGADIYSPDGIVTLNGGSNYYSYLPSKTDSLVNLSPGNYTIQYAYTTGNPWALFLKGMSKYSADRITQSFTIPPYTQPAFAAAPAIALCGSNRSIALLPDSTTGVVPYRYRIATGPVTTSMQPGPVFQNLPKGTYTLLMEDACGNSYSNNYAIDTLLLPPIVTTGTTCAGGNATLRLHNSPLYSYRWQKPNGALVNGNEIVINPVTQADTGTYYITVTSSIGGCTDTRVQAVQFNFCTGISLPLTLVYFKGKRSGSQVLLEWQTADEVNTSQFIVERSTDGIHFSRLKQVKATGNGKQHYTVTDQQPLTDKCFYRLQMIDKDGAVTYSRVIALNIDADGITVYPRLITANEPIQITYPAAARPVSIQVIDMNGITLFTQPVCPGSTQTSIPAGKLPKGSFVIVLDCSGSRQAKQVVKW